MKGGGEDNKKAENAEHKILETNLIFKKNWLSLVVSLVWLGQVISPSRASVFDIRGGCRVEISLSSLTTFILCGSSPSRFTNSQHFHLTSLRLRRRGALALMALFCLFCARAFFPLLIPSPSPHPQLSEGGRTSCSFHSDCRK